MRDLLAQDMDKIIGVVREQALAGDDHRACSFYNMETGLDCTQGDGESDSDFEVRAAALGFGNTQ